MPFRRRRPPATTPEENPSQLDPAQVAAGYHQRTKHHPYRFAASLGYLDWDSQPDPFRRHAGAPLLELPVPIPNPLPPVSQALPPAYDALFDPGALPPAPLSRESLAQFLYHSLALSAWKSAGGNTWALRVNPSSGNLHPTEGWLLLPALSGLTDAPAVLHYAPREHALEQRALLDPTTWTALTDGLPASAFLVALSSIPWRESWKYGERAYRYCQHDVGHAVGALRVAAALLGWRMELLPASDALVAGLLGLDRDDGFLPEEPEHADLLAVVFPADAAGDAATAGGWSVDEGAVLSSLRQASWSGRPQRLSPEHQPWEVVEVAAAACRRNEPPRDWWKHAPTLRLDPVAAALPAAPTGALTPPIASTVIRGRRSAVAMDGTTALPRDAFLRLVARTVPALCPVPWDAWPHAPAVHLGLFVHRVTGLPPGLYALVRDETALPALRASMHDTFRWERPEGVPEELPLYLLVAADARRPSASMSCNQDIAGDGAFSLGMLADFDETLRTRGGPGYRELFWETGLIGQLLYLEAEALGVRATGIGCFFDDSVHAAFGLSDTHWQSLYHFTVGGPLDDDRITSLPAYPAPGD